MKARAIALTEGTPCLPRPHAVSRVARPSLTPAHAEVGVLGTVVSSRSSEARWNSKVEVLSTVDYAEPGCTRSPAVVSDALAVVARSAQAMSGISTTTTAARATSDPVMRPATPLLVAGPRMGSAEGARGPRGHHRATPSDTPLARSLAVAAPRNESTYGVRDG